MEGELLLLLLLLAWLIIGPIVALIKAGKARAQADEQQQELRNLRQQVELLRQEVFHQRQGPPVAGPAADAWEVPSPAATPEPAQRPDLVPLLDALWATRREEPLADSGGPAPSAVEPPPLPRSGWSPEPEAEESAAPEEPPGAPFSLEHFMGVKLFAWLGGVALFFGVIFFVKYAFENNLIPKEVRVALGFLTGIGLLVSGLVLHRRATYLVLAHAFCATGVLILYGVSFAAHAVYHFALFSSGMTFALMALITLAAFLVAVRLNALVVAVLGMLGGFITPLLLSTGRDQLLGLFSYIALLVIGLAAVSRHRNWSFLVPSAAIGTALMQWGWFVKFFVNGHYEMGSKTLLPMAILVFFELLFLIVGWLAKRRDEATADAAGSALGMAGMALLFAFAMLAFPAVSQRIPVLFGFLLLQNMVVLGCAWLHPRWTISQLANALLSFLLLAIWMGRYLTSENLVSALVVVLVFGAFHAVAPVVLCRLAPQSESPVPLRVWPWAAPISLLLLLMPIVNLPEPSLWVWPAAVVVNLLAVLLAVATGAMLPVLGGLAITFLLILQWLFNVPVQVASLTPFLGITLGFSAVFTVAGRWLSAKAAPGDSAPENDMEMLEQRVAAMLPVLSGVLPFGLLLLAIQRLPLVNPSPVFGVALLLVVLLLGLAVLTRQAALVPAAFVGILAVQALWHGVHFDPEFHAVPLLWYLGCYALFLGFPFGFRRASEAQIWPWITAALAGVGYFLLVHNGVQRSFPGMAGRMGLVPTAFAIPSLVALGMVVRMAAKLDPVKRNQLAWFGGVALFFITLIFPIQFDRQWLTVSWALEGALLLWLFRRVAHPGLQFTGLGLLAVTFVRLVFNPAVFTDYPRSGTAILNWHLYTYGIVAIAQFLAARWFIDPEKRLQGVNIRGVLVGLGGVLLFVLLNLEIADYFTPPGELMLSFGRGVNFQRDMTYSIAWGLFALGLLSLGIWFKARPARYAAIGLLVVTLLKVFVHDLSSLASVFRIGALIGVAVIAFIASFLYQQFFNRTKSP